MAADIEGLGLTIPEQILTVATAIADRKAEQAAIGMRIASEIQGLPYIEKPLEVQRAEHLGRSALLLLQVENPSLITTVEQNMDHQGDVGYAATADEMSEKYGFTVEPENVRSVKIALMREFQKVSGMDGEKEAENFSKLLAAAKAVAQKHGVELEAVYSEDALYYEACSEAYTPEDDADELISILGAISSEIYTRVTLQMINQLMPKELLATLSQREIDEMCLELQLDPEFDTLARQTASMDQEVNRQTFLHYFVSAFGHDALNGLSQERREALTPRLPLAREVAEVVNSKS